MLQDTGMEPVVAVAIGVLASICVISLVIIIVVLIHRYCQRRPMMSQTPANDLISQQHRNARPEVNLVDNMEGDSEIEDHMELDNVHFKRHLQKILEDETWVNDVTGLAPHCLAILKICHTLTEKLVGMTMGNASQLRSQEMITDLVTVAKRISPRVDEIVKTMYPPLDPRLLEARCTALVLSVTHLVIITKNACHLSGVLDWVNQSLAEVEEHLQHLREASEQYDSALQQNLTNTVNLEPGSTQGQGHPGQERMQGQSEGHSEV